MPIYEYACNSCDHRLEALQKISDEPLTECPECGDAALRRLLSAPRFRLKGQGWYETDFKKDNQRNILSGDEAPSKAKDKADDGAKSDSKGEAKKEAKEKTEKKASSGNTT